MFLNNAPRLFECECRVVVKVVQACRDRTRALVGGQDESVTGSCNFAFNALLGENDALAEFDGDGIVVDVFAE